MAVGKSWARKAGELGIALAANKGRIEQFVRKVYDQENNEFKFASWKGKFRSFIRMMKAFFKGQYKLISPWLFIHTAVAITYIITNADLIPDKLYKLGFLDDVAVIIWMIETYSYEIEKFEMWEAENQIQNIQIA